jgi:Tfp pilus assembly PilM family ATPase
VFSKLLTRPVVGVDINAAEVRLLCLRKQRRVYHVENYAFAALPSGAVADGKIRVWGPVQDALQKLVRQTRTQTCRAGFALPAQQVRFQQITSALVPVDKAAYFQHCAGFQSELCFDYHATPENNILLAAASLEQVNQLVALAAQVELDIQLVTVDSYALTRAISLQAANGVLLDIAPEVTQLLVLQNHTIIFQRYWPTTANDFAAQLEAALTQSSGAWREAALFISGQLLPAETVNPLTLGFSWVCPFANMTLARHLDARLLMSAAPRLLLCCGLALENFAR